MNVRVLILFYCKIRSMINGLFISADRYTDALFPEDKDLRNAAGSAVAAGLHDISVSHNQGRFLQVLARLCNAKKILELGTFVGYSAICLAKALPKDGQLLTIEYDASNAAIAQKNFDDAGLNKMITMRTGKAIDLLPEIEKAGEGPFDMIFIDADKPPYAEYFQWALRLSRPGTLIVVDNVVRHVFDPNTPEDKRAGVERFNKLLAECSAVTATIIQTVGAKEPDGMAIAVVN
jgi:predicted O-methyltransferase YrrM